MGKRKRMVLEDTGDEDEPVYVCQVCGTARVMDNWGGHAGIKLVDETGLPGAVIGFWCSRKCFDADSKGR